MIAILGINGAQFFPPLSVKIGETKKEAVFVSQKANSFARVEHN
jgi:hypothetical protein